MAVVISMVLPGIDLDQYREVHRRVSEAVPQGLLIHTAGATEDGLRVVDVWESSEAFDRFQASRLAEAIADSPMAGAPPAVERWELGNVWTPSPDALAARDNFGVAT